MNETIEAPDRLAKEKEANNIQKKELLTILSICVIVIIVLGVLYYFERTGSVITHLGERISNGIL